MKIMRKFIPAVYFGGDCDYQQNNPGKFSLHLLQKFINKKYSITVHMLLIFHLLKSTPKLHKFIQ